MSKNRIILTIGVILVLNPFLGFPSSWETVLYILFGFILVILSFFVSIKRRITSPRTFEHETDSTSEPFVDGYRFVEQNSMTDVGVDSSTEEESLKNSQ